MNRDKLKLLFFSISPFVISKLFIYLIRLEFLGMELTILSILFSIYWFFAGYKSYDYVESKMESILIGNSFAIISIILVVLQVGLMGRYMSGIIGTFPQYFYLPMSRVSFVMESILYIFIKYTSNSMINSIISFILMIFLYSCGYKVAEDLNLPK